MFEKPKRLIDLKYRKWITTCSCYACLYEKYWQEGIIPEKTSPFTKEYLIMFKIINLSTESYFRFDNARLSDPHHTRKKDDKYLMPLCDYTKRDHHGEVESINGGKKSFAKKYGIENYDKLTGLYRKIYLERM